MNYKRYIQNFSSHQLVVDQYVDVSLIDFSRIQKVYIIALKYLNIYDLIQQFQNYNKAFEIIIITSLKNHENIWTNEQLLNSYHLKTLSIEFESYLKNDNRIKMKRSILKTFIYSLLQFFIAPIVFVKNLFYTYNKEYFYGIYKNIYVLVYYKIGHTFFYKVIHKFFIFLYYRINFVINFIIFQIPGYQVRLFWMIVRIFHRIHEFNMKTIYYPFRKSYWFIVFQIHKRLLKKDIKRET